MKGSSRRIYEEDVLVRLLNHTYDITMILYIRLHIDNLSSFSLTITRRAKYRGAQLFSLPNLLTVCDANVLAHSLIMPKTAHSSLASTPLAKPARLKCSCQVSWSLAKASALCVARLPLQLDAQDEHRIEHSLEALISTKECRHRYLKSSVPL